MTTESRDGAEAKLIPLPRRHVDDGAASRDGAEVSEARTGEQIGSEVPDRECFIAIHKFARLTRRETRVLAHPACQRLRNIYQLGQTHLVYPSATHRRFEHALGCLFVAQLISDTLDRNSTRRGSEPEREWRLDEALTREEITFVRLGALLHDIGHLPMGHTFEDELGLFAPHDADLRLAMIFDRLDWHINAARDPAGYPDIEDALRAHTPSLRELVDGLYAEEANSSRLGASPTEIVFKLTSKDHTDEHAPDGCDFRLQVCRDLIGNTICADLLDYLHRDWHHLGKHKELDLRLVDYMELRRNVTNGESALVVSLRRPADVRSDGVSAILDLLESRYNLFEIALYHRTKLCATAMLERAVGELHDARRDDREQWLQTLLVRLIDASDESMLDMLGEEAHALLQRGGDGSSRDDETLRNIVRTTVDLRFRRLHKAVYHATHYELRPGDADRVRGLYAPGPKAVETPSPTGSGSQHSLPDAAVAARNRMLAMRELEEDFGLPPLSLTMYCATRETSMKVAGVKILFDDKVRTLESHESEFEQTLTGGHLSAQKRRFQGLWRVLIACDQHALDELESKDLRKDLVEAIRWGVLGLNSDDQGVSLARELVRKPGSPWCGREVDEQADARIDLSSSPGYPSKRRALRTFLHESDAPRP